MTEQPNQLEDFKARLRIVEEDLRGDGAGDGRIMFILGSLAVHLIDGDGYVSWRHFKANVPAEQLQELVEDMIEKGNEETRFGDKKNTYAMQAIASSLMCRHFKGAPGLAKLEDGIDTVITKAAKQFREWKKSQPGKVH